MPFDGSPCGHGGAGWATTLAAGVGLLLEDCGIREVTRVVGCVDDETEDGCEELSGETVTVTVTVRGVGLIEV